MEPLFYNPHMRGEWGERILDDASAVRAHRERVPQCRLMRGTPERTARAHVRYELTRAFAAVGVTHVGHIVQGWDGGDLRLMSSCAFMAQFGRSRPAPCTREQYESLVAALPGAWRDVILRAGRCRRLHHSWDVERVCAETPLPDGAWVQRAADGLVGQLTSGASGQGVGVWFEPSRAGRLAVAAAGRRCLPRGSGLTPRSMYGRRRTSPTASLSVRGASAMRTSSPHPSCGVEGRLWIGTCCAVVAR